MAALQPDNLKLLARAALTNISQLMESQQASPPLTTVCASIRVLTRAFPALLSDPALRSWCWARRRLPYLLSYLDHHDHPRAPQPQQRQGLNLQDQQREGPIPRGRFPKTE
ncbi:unnamed protein product, partial [Hapterophycus canaliculatus]